MRYSYATVALPTLEPERAIAELSDAGYERIEWKVGEAPHAANSTASEFLLDNRCALVPESVDTALDTAPLWNKDSPIC